MHLPQHSTTVAVQPAKAGAAASGYFTKGNPGTNTPATVVPYDFLNTLIVEGKTLVEAAGLTLDKANDGQWLQAVRNIVAAYMGISIVSGAQVSGHRQISGASFVGDGDLSRGLDGTDPLQNVGTLYAAAGTAIVLVAELQGLPQGAQISNFVMNVGINAGAAKGALVRRARNSNTGELLITTAGGQSLGSGDTSLTVVGTSARVVDNASYTYHAWIAGTSTAADLEINSARVQFTLPDPTIS